MKIKVTKCNKLVRKYTELCIENYFLRKITQLYQNNLQIFS